MEYPLAKLKASLTDMPTTARRIASYLVEYPDAVLDMSLLELAEATKASEGSIISLCRQIGAKGFPELKIAIAKEISVSRSLLHEAIMAGDDTKSIISKIASSHMLAIEDTVKVLDAAAVNRAAELLLAAKRIEFYGVGTSAPIAEDAAYRFLRLGLSTKSVTDAHGQAVSAAFAGPDVATVTISHSGRSQETLDSTRIAKEAGARTICITNFGKSPLQQYCDEVLYTSSQETRYRMEALSSRLAQLVVIDILYARLAVLRWQDSLEAIQRSYNIINTKRVRG
jgi:DNA-binding MurR/RpiR family transcriptional regulator